MKCEECNYFTPIVSLLFTATDMNDRFGYTRRDSTGLGNMATVGSISTGGRGRGGPPFHGSGRGQGGRGFGRQPAFRTPKASWPNTVAVPSGAFLK